MIRLAAEVLAAIRRHGEAAYPEECCGALLGTVDADLRGVSVALPLDNSRQEERRRRFLIGPEDYRGAERAARERGLVLVGFYHSHPDHPARPSAYDLEHALPWHSYVILAVREGRAEEWTAWILSEDRERFEAEESFPNERQPMLASTDSLPGEGQPRRASTVSRRGDQQLASASTADRRAKGGPR